METEARQLKHKLWKTIVGWTLFVVGTTGLATNLIFPFFTPLQLYASLEQSAISTAICLLLIYGGWKLIDNKNERMKKIVCYAIGIPLISFFGFIVIGTITFHYASTRIGIGLPFIAIGILLIWIARKKIKISKVETIK